VTADALHHGISARTGCVIAYTGCNTSRIAAHPPGQPAQLTQLGVSFQQPGHDQPRRAVKVTEQTSMGHPDMVCNYFNAAGNTPLP
jgi:hypothetical protein